MIDREVESPDQAFSARQPVDASTISEAPVLKEDGSPNAWAIQVGSFSTYERALEVRDQLIEVGYKSYFRAAPAVPDDDELHRIMVGPYVNATEVAEHRAGISELLGVETILMEYTP